MKSDDKIHYTKNHKDKLYYQSLILYTSIHSDFNMIKNLIVKHILRLNYSVKMINNH